MSDFLGKEIGYDLLKQIYLHKGGVEVEILRGIINATYELSEDLFNGVLEGLVDKEYCVVESIKKLNNSTEKVVFITMKGLEQLEKKRKVSMKTVLANKISYEMKCEGCASFSEWLEKNRSMLAFEDEKTRMYATALGNMDIILMDNGNEREIRNALQAAKEQIKERTKVVPALLKSIDYSVVWAVYEKLERLVGEKNFIEEVNNTIKLMTLVLHDRYDCTIDFL